MKLASSVCARELARPRWWEDGLDREVVDVEELCRPGSVMRYVTLLVVAFGIHVL